MEELLLLCNEQSERREAAEHEIESLRDTDLNAFINSLVEVCTTSANPIAISLALIFLYNAFTKITISEYGVEIFNQVAEFSFSMISNENDTVAQQSSSLFGLVVGTLYRCSLAGNLINEIAGNIQPDKDARNIHFILVSLRELLSSTQLEGYAQKTIFTALMNLASNEEFAVDVIDTLIVMADDITLAVSQEEIRNQFLELIFGFTKVEELKPKCYLFWEKLAESSWSVFVPVLKDLFGLILEDIMSSTIPDVVVNACVVIKRVAVRQRKESVTYLDFSFYNASIEQLFNIMISNTPEEVDNSEDWGPYYASSETIAALSKTFPKQAESILPTFIQQLAANEDLPSKEASLLGCRILAYNGIIFDFESEFSLIAENLVSESPRIRIEALQCLAILIDQTMPSIEEGQAELFLGTLEVLSELVKDEIVPCVCTAIYDIGRIALLEGSPKDEILALLLQFLASENYLVSNSAYFSLTSYLEESITGVSDSLQLIPPLIELVNEASETNEDIFSNAVSTLTYAINCAGIGGSEMYGDLLEVLIQNPNIETLELCSIIIKNIGNGIVPYAEQIVQMFGSAIQEADYDTTTIICSYLLHPTENEFFGPCACELCTPLLEKYGDESICETEEDYTSLKVNILTILGSFISHYPELAEGVAPVIFEKVQENIEQTTAENFDIYLIDASLFCLGKLIKRVDEMGDPLIEYAFTAVTHLYEISLMNNYVCAYVFRLLKQITYKCPEAILGFREQWSLFDSFILEALEGKVSKKYAHAVKNYFSPEEEEEYFE